MIRLTKRGQQWQMLGSISCLTRFIFLRSVPTKLLPRNVYFNYCSKRRNFSNYCSAIVAPSHPLFHSHAWTSGKIVSAPKCSRFVLVDFIALEPRPRAFFFTTYDRVTRIANQESFLAAWSFVHSRTGIPVSV